MRVGSPELWMKGFGLFKVERRAVGCVVRYTNACLVIHLMSSWCFKVGLHKVTLTPHPNQRNVPSRTARRYGKPTTFERLISCIEEKALRTSSWSWRSFCGFWSKKKVAADSVLADDSLPASMKPIAGPRDCLGKRCAIYTFL